MKFEHTARGRGMVVNWRDRLKILKWCAMLSTAVLVAVLGLITLISLSTGRGFPLGASSLSIFLFRTVLAWLALTAFAYVLADWGVLFVNAVTKRFGALDLLATLALNTGVLFVLAGTDLFSSEAGASLVIGIGAAAIQLALVLFLYKYEQGKYALHKQLGSNQNAPFLPRWAGNFAAYFLFIAGLAILRADFIVLADLLAPLF